MQDITGREIQLGDLVVRPWNKTYLALGLVYKINDSFVYIVGAASVKVKDIYASDRIAIVDSASKLQKENLIRKVIWELCNVDYYGNPKTDYNTLSEEDKEFINSLCIRYNIDIQDLIGE